MHKLSNYIELFTEPDKDMVLEYYVMITKSKSRLYLINEGIFNFLQQFEVPNNLEQVTTAYVKSFKINSEQSLKKLESQLLVFFQDLVNRKWIVHEDTFEAPVKRETIFKKNDIFSTFKVSKVLANNKLTDVYLVNGENSKKYVVKLLNRGKFKDDKSFAKYSDFLDAENKFLKTFKSIYINKSLGYRTFKRQPFMILEYINGISLQKYVEKNVLVNKEKHKLVLKILRAFSIIHSANVYHGDIHFSNILVKEGQHIKVIDFGYANNAVSIHNTINKKPRNGGVYTFIPPERAKPSIFNRFSAVTQFQSEVYQIGLLIYFIYVRRLPFQSETWKTMVAEKQAFNLEEHKPFLNRRMPKAVRDFIIKSMDTDPEKRFANASTMLKAWQKIS